MKWWRLRSRNADLERELQSDLDLEELEQRESGLTTEDARYAARRAFGNATLIREQTQEAWGWAAVEHIVQDFRYALRQMRRSPGFACVAILTLALGMGANTAVFSVVDAVLLKPLGYPDPDRIIQMFLWSPQGSAKGQSIEDFRFLMEHANSLQDISAYDFAQSEMGLTSDTPEQVHGIHVSAGYFQLFGVPFRLGRAFNQNEDRAQGADVVVVSYGLWQRRFGGNEQIIGKHISLDKQWYTVVGVANESFHAEPDAQLWIPFHFNLNRADQLHSFGIAARIKPGISLEQANAQLDAASEAARRDSTLPDPDLHFQVRRFRDAMIENVRSSLLTMQGAVILVLLIACANVANLLLMRTTVRKRELAIRGAIGAGRGRIARQLTIESFILCALGCVLGTCFGLAGVHALLLASPASLPRIQPSGKLFALDWRVLAFAAAMSVLTAVVFGVLPAIIACRNGFENALRDSGQRAGMGKRGRRSLSAIAAGEIALSLTLIIGASLLVRTFIALNSVKPGFESHNVVLMTMPLSGDRHDTAAGVAAMVRDARSRLAAIPGIEDSAATFSSPFASRMGLPFLSTSGGGRIEGDAMWQAVSPGYMNVLKIPVLRGRTFEDNDNAAAQGVVLINEAMAMRYWPGRNPIGQQLRLGEGLGTKFADRPRQIIGIVADVRDENLSQAPEPAMMIPDAQAPDGIVEMETGFGPLWWLVRTRVPAGPLIPAISDQLLQASAGRPVGSVQTLDDVLSASLASQRFNMLLLGSFATIAFLLGAIGIYGVIAYSVAQRGHEIGVRIALGADRVRVRQMILREGMMMGLAGIAAGVAGAFFLVRLLAGLLYGVSMRDPAVFIAVPVLLLLVIAIATWIPARRAGRLDPVRALRAE
ncbi:MAG TPA: ABC transporter permease [Terracidiphilus sp.]|jgi:predicted permease